MVAAGPGNVALQHRALDSAALRPRPLPPRPLRLGPGNRGFLPVPDGGGGDVTALLVGAAEGRHLLLTAARAQREPRFSITIFVAERRPEAVARQLLFLLLATAEGPGSSGLRARAAALLELMGSVRLRPSTARLLRGAAGRLRRWVTAGGGGGPPSRWS
ncbi:dynein axonemal assembly factor 3 [Cyrtonyx montezumae]|uniref:dynein axonemal assembly factor 3 n=1 Tax=Cyrtonyx montezumae TaxID=9017 RepID=UPI0032DBB6BF